MNKITITIIFLLSISSLYSSEYKQDIIEKVDDYLNEISETLPIPGFSVVVADKEGIVFSSGYGVEIAGTNIPMTDRSINAIGSLTKSFTAMAILQLVDKGLVDLDACVTEYIPWFRTMNKDLSDLITIRMLLSMSSGIPRIDDWVYRMSRNEDSLEKGVRSLASASINRQPGESFAYSNENYNILGLVIEMISGKSYAEFMQQEVLAPMDMNKSTTDFFNKSNIYKNGELTGGHNLQFDKYIPSEIKFSMEALPAGSFFRTNAKDLGNYLQTLLNEGVYKGEKIISRESFSQLWTPEVSYPSLSIKMGGTGEFESYCMGWVKSSIEGREMIHHGGEVQQMSSFTMLDPDRGIGVSILYNAGGVLDKYKYPDEINIVNNILHIMAGEKITEYGIPDHKDPNLQYGIIKPDNMDEYCGVYIDDKQKAEIYKENNILYLRFSTTIFSNTYILEFINNDLGITKSIPGVNKILFSRNDAGIITSISAQGRILSYRQELPGKTSIQSSDNRYSFSVSINSDIALEKKKGEIKLSDNSGIIFDISNNYIPLEFIKKNIGFETLLIEGYSFNRSSNLKNWNEQSFKVNKNNIDYGITVLSTSKNGETFYALLYAPIGDLSRIVIKQAETIISTFEWM